MAEGVAARGQARALGHRHRARRPRRCCGTDARASGQVSVAITRVGAADLPDLLPLMRGYSGFYDVNPSDEELLALACALIANPEFEGLQLIARDGDDGTALGFATIYWLWSTSRAARIGVMNDLFTAPEARRRGVGEALIRACLEAVRERGAAILQ